MASNAKQTAPSGYALQVLAAPLHCAAVGFSLLSLTQSCIFIHNPFDKLKLTWFRKKS
jgi:hypothetical protein